MYGIVIDRMVATDLEEARRAGFLGRMVERRDMPSTLECDWHADAIGAVMADLGFATTDAAIDEIREGYARALKESLDAEVDNAEGDDAEGDDEGA